MSYEQTNDDLLYIEDGYLTPDGYYVYIALGNVSIAPYIEEGYIEVGYYDDYSVQGSLTCLAQVVQGQEVEANGSWQSAFSTTATISRIRENIVSIAGTFSQTAIASKNSSIDLFAFSNAQMAVEVQRIRDNNIDVSAVFAINIDGSRVRFVSSEEPSQFSFSVINERSRATSVVTQAAFSLSALAEDRLRSQSVNCEISSTLSSNSGFRLLGSAAATAYFLVNTSRYVGSNRPITVAGTFNSTELINSANRSPTDLTPLNTNDNWFFQTRISVQRISGIGDTNWQGRRLLLIPNVLDISLDRTASTATTTLFILYLGNSISHFVNQNNGDPFTFSGEIAVQFRNGQQLSIYLNRTRVRQFSLVDSPTAVKNATVQFASSFPLTVNSRTWHSFTDYSWLTLGDYTGGASTYEESLIPVNTENTIFLYNFNGNGQETTAGILTLAANITSVVTASTTARKTIVAQSSITSNSSLSCTISHIEGADMQAFADGNLSATVTRLKPLDANLSCESTVVCDAVKVLDAFCDFNSQSDIIADNSRIRDLDIQVSALATQLTAVARLAGLFIDDLTEFNLSADVVGTFAYASDITASTQIVCDNVKVRFFDIAITGTAALASEADIRKVANADLSSNFDQTVINARTRDILAELNSSSTLTAVAFNLGKIECSLFNNCSLDAIAVKTTANIVAAFSQSTLTAINDRFRDLSSDTSLSASIIIDSSKTVGVSADMSALASKVTVVAKTAEGISLNVGEFVLTGSAISTASALGELNVTNVVSAEAIITASAASDLACTASIIIDAISGKLAEANLSVLAFNLTAAVRIASPVGDLDCQFALSVDAVAIRSTSADLSSTHEVNISGDRIRFALGSLESSSSLSAAAGLTLSAVANIASAMSFQTQIRDLRLDEIEYVIPGEIWVYDISGETRLYTIRSETRLHTIK